MARRPRGLRPEEQELWHRVARSATPLHPARAKTEHPLTTPAPKPGQPPKPDHAPLPVFRIGQSASPTPGGAAPSRAEGLAAAPVRMDRKAFVRLRQGKLTPEARIDLHGLTLADAHPELIRFILASHGAGRRLVLVITGKGQDRDGPDDGPLFPQRRGVLRRQVPLWLSAPPLARIVQQVAQAHRRHGGEGAFYVYLSRS
ncbi:DNA mismatch repair protein MutS [Defluviimonas sp. 20V17]|uniref:DNA mismatch repair protein MutS n=1 Tax=Allgaiera indica TaxID=765699 RepID=A0AAN4UNE2_9RHOB|nr:Smr/MutS family protein [Allgaiera indica]KDB03619.1 DNA mismatch repair protein MutS [Defluviimonas sp. 20V17]GHD98272.1 DNA mismatch repair protein MutS [Allgaiera indica]SDW50348.1 DNA-nicking endonuclease, Smr domain [Allgaiera indica]